MTLAAVVFSASLFVSSLAYATPTTTFRAPSIATCQAAGVLLPSSNPVFLFLNGRSSPDITVNRKGLKKVDVIVGPVFFLDRAQQPGGATRMWTTQLDVDIPLGR
jgi:hypothetical protein